MEGEDSSAVEISSDLVTSEDESASNEDTRTRNVSCKRSDSDEPIQNASVDNEDSVHVEDLQLHTGVHLYASSDTSEESDDSIIAAHDQSVSEGGSEDDQLPSETEGMDTRTASQRVRGRPRTLRGGRGNASTRMHPPADEEGLCSDDTDTGSSESDMRPTATPVQDSTIGRGRGASRSRGRGRGRGRPRGSQSRRYIDFIPGEATPISVDDDFSEWNEFLPLREPGPHIPDGHSSTPLDLVELFITTEMLEQFVVATNAYAEAKKESKPAMYLRFKQSPLTQNEMIRYIGVYLLLSVNSVRSYRKAWNKRSSQVKLYVNLHGNDMQSMYIFIYNRFLFASLT